MQVSAPTQGKTRTILVRYFLLIYKKTLFINAIYLGMILAN